MEHYFAVHTSRKCVVSWFILAWLSQSCSKDLLCLNSFERTDSFDWNIWGELVIRSGAGKNWNVNEFLLYATPIQHSIARHTPETGVPGEVQPVALPLTSWACRSWIQLEEIKPKPLKLQMRKLSPAHTARGGYQHSGALTLTPELLPAAPKMVCLIP